MSQKPIKPTQEMINEALKQLTEKLQRFNCFDGKIKFESDVWEYPESDKKVRIEFTETAMKKQNRLIDDFTTEVGWHGVVTRDPEDPLHYIIEDILVFPQVVTGVTVDTDDVGYAKWLAELDDETFNKLRYHGHSHVNMGTSPSGTDNKYQDDILGQLTNDDYYIFLIWNKRGECTARVFDLKANTMFDENDVEIIKPELTDDLSAFMQDAMNKVSSRTYSYQTQPKSYVYAASATTPKSVKEKGKKKEGAKAASSIYPYDDMYDDYWGYGNVNIWNANRY